ncbi:hypothetical protein [Moorena sp. SIO3I6]|uniref:hypothetical protein n=1 Tax=Moorena sp. SIO3I6 TaxID=2607831 RepID=UPI0013F82769|nr:hypothetical protein [Moorena sp. SIO3I6]NEO45541.1 hypothetical protein [Moorena sp. SIO4A3]NEP28696.1 hypothetical protein [Moorena sp. SIO3I6]
MAKGLSRASSLTRIYRVYHSYELQIVFSLLPAPCSEVPAPCSLFPAPKSLLPVP